MHIERRPSEQVDIAGHWRLTAATYRAGDVDVSTENYQGGARLIVQPGGLGQANAGCRNSDVAVALGGDEVDISISAIGEQRGCPLMVAGPLDDHIFEALETVTSGSVSTGRVAMVDVRVLTLVGPDTELVFQLAGRQR